MPNVLSDDITERRLALRDQLLTTGPEHCDMGTWFHIESNPRDGFALCDAPAIDIDACGTTACLAGHAALLLDRVGVHVCGEADIARWFGLEHDAFYRPKWYAVYVDDDSNDTLQNVYVTAVEDGATERVAEWTTLLAYLDHLIKSDD